MRVIDREQAKIVAGFGSTTRANARLLALTRAGLLRRFFLGSRKSLYALSEKGARLVGVPVWGPRRRQDEVLVANFFVEHQLAVNDMYCELKYGATQAMEVSFRRWRCFKKPITGDCHLIPDGYAELTTPAGIVAAFLEVDLGNERGSEWKEKSNQYLRLALSGEFERQFGLKQFRVLVLANSERRVHSLRKIIAAVTPKIFWFATLGAVTSQGVLAPVWYRPTGETATAFIEERP
jgi:hypothetical protein